MSDNEPSVAYVCIPLGFLRRFTQLCALGGFRLVPVQVDMSEAPRFTLDDSISPVAHAPGGLSDREFQVLACLAAGYSNAKIGRTMGGLSEDTVKTHASRLYRKLGVHDRAEAVAVGYQRGLLSVGAS